MNFFLIDKDVMDTLAGNDKEIDITEFMNTAFKDICEKDRASEDLFTKCVILFVEIAHTHTRSYISIKSANFPKFIKTIYSFQEYC